MKAPFFLIIRTLVNAKPKIMANSFILAVLFSFLSLSPMKKEAPRLKAQLCNTESGEVSTADLRDCNEIILSIPGELRAEYEGARIAAYSFVYSPKTGEDKRMPAMENVTGSKLTNFATKYINLSVTGDEIRIANIMIETKAGRKMLLNEDGPVYTIIE
jgi:hypothetical protein